MRKGRPRSSAVHICPNGRILSHPQAYLVEREASAHIHVRKGGSAGEMEHHKTTCRIVRPKCGRFDGLSTLRRLALNVPRRQRTINLKQKMRAELANCGPGITFRDNLPRHATCRWA